jgi:hypothetical protein
MGTWQKLRALSFAEILILTEAAVLLTSVWVGLRLLPFRALRRLHGEGPLPSPSLLPASGTPAKVAWAVRVMAHRLPGKMTCLVQALVAHTMLRRRGYRSDLRIGVAGREPSGEIKAHAWVEHEGRIVIGELEDLGAYAVLASPSR